MRETKVASFFPKDSTTTKQLTDTEKSNEEYSLRNNVDLIRIFTNLLRRAGSVRRYVKATTTLVPQTIITYIFQLQTLNYRNY